MASLRIVLKSVGLAIAWTTATAHAQNVVFEKGGWRGMVLQSSSEFRGCLAITTATRSDQLVIGQFANRSWFVGLTRTGGFRRNLQYRITLAVDGRPILTGTSKVTDDGIAIIEPTLDAGSVSA